MPITKVTEYRDDKTLNLDVDGGSIDPTASYPEDAHKAISGVMAHWARVNDGTDPLHDTVTFADPNDPTKTARLDSGSVTPGQTRVLVIPDEDVDLGQVAATASRLDDINAGTSPFLDTVTFADPADLTKAARLDAGSVTSGETRVITMADKDINLADAVLYGASRGIYPEEQIFLKNNKAIVVKSTGGNYYSVLYLDSGNSLRLGDETRGLVLRGSSLETIGLSIVQDIRFGSSVSPGNPTNVWRDAPAGHVVWSAYFAGDARCSNVRYKPLQKLINTTWVTASG